ncbi:hypothetical protein AHAS_Ahas02G0105800 [Arachis hypogaea]
MEKHQAHRHVLVNCDAVVPFVESQSKIDSVVHTEFSRWFKHEVSIESTLHSKEMKLLPCGSMIQARRFGAYNVNGYKFRIITKEGRLKTQNSGVYVSSNTRSYASMRDNRVAISNHLGLTSVNFSRPIHIGDREEDEPYILASKAQLVYYMNDEEAKEWSVVVHVKPRYFV